MSFDNITLKYIDDITCDICRTNVIDDVAGVSCCYRIFHAYCLDQALEHSNQCPRCEKMYKVNLKDPLMKYLINTSSINITDIYSDIYASNPAELILIDNVFTKILTMKEYHAKFIGYYPLVKFNKIFNLEQFQDNWRTFTYGLLDNYDWLHTLTCGRAVFSLSRGHTNIEDEHAYLVIYGTDYRKVRTQISTLLKCIETNLGDKCYLHIEEGIIVVHMRGIVRKICIYIEYHSDPFWFIYNDRPYFNSHGTFYSPSDGIKQTCEALVRTDPSVHPELNTLAYIMTYKEQQPIFAKRIGRGIVSRQFLLNNIYQNYRLVINIRNGIDSIKQQMINQILNGDINKVIDVELCISQTMDNDYSFHLTTDTSRLTIPCVMVTPRKINDNVVTMVYKQPVLLLPRIVV